MRVLSVVALAVCFGVTGCAEGAGREVSSATAAPPPATSPAASPTPAKSVLTEKDSGETVTLHGNVISVRLSNDWVWQEPRVLGGAVRLDPVNYVVDPGYTEWAVNAVRAGMSTVHIQGLPKQTGPGKTQGPLDVTYSFNVN